MLKKAGMVVLGATAGMLTLAPLASAGEAGPDQDSHRSHSSSDCDGASARQGGQLNTGDQAVGVNNVNVQAPINQIGVLSRLDSDDRGRGGDCGDNDRKKQRHGNGGHDRHDGHGHGGRGGDNDGGGASAVQRGQINTGDQLIGVNNVNVQLPINQLGVLSDIDD